jgi:hypothetical protein
MCVADCFMDIIGVWERRRIRMYVGWDQSAAFIFSFFVFFFFFFFCIFIFIFFCCPYFIFNTKPTCTTF